MKRLVLIFIMMNWIFIAGCSTRLTISVDIYDGPLRLTNHDALVVAASQPVFDKAKQDGWVKNVIDDTLERYKDYQVNQHINRPSPSNGSETSTEEATKKANNLADKARISLDDAWGEHCEKAANDVGRAVILFNSMNGSTDFNYVSYQNLMDKLLAFEVGFREFETKTKVALGLPLGADAQLEAIMDRIQKERISIRQVLAQNQSSTGPAVGSPVFDVRIAEIIENDQSMECNNYWENSSPDHWVPFSQNEFHASGGDAQFVVIRDGLVVFRQKSLDFDPTAVAGASAALARAGMSAAAALATGTISGYGAAAGSNETEAQEASSVNGAEIEINEMIQEGEQAKASLTSYEAARRNALAQISRLLIQASSETMTAKDLQHTRAQLGAVLRQYEATTNK